MRHTGVVAMSGAGFIGAITVKALTVPSVSTATRALRAR